MIVDKSINKYYNIYKPKKKNVKKQKKIISWT